MNDQWLPLPIWLKVFLALTFALVLFFAVASIILAQWSVALFTWATVIVAVALFGPFGEIARGINGRLSKAQMTALGALPLVAVWVARFVIGGDRSPVLGAVVVGFGLWIAKNVIDEGWSRHPD